MKPAPLRFAPAFYPRIWGARSLAPLFPDAPLSDEPIGEAWLTGDDCVFATGHWTGRRVGDAWREMTPEWAGERLAPLTAKPHFPILVKYIFPEEKLSVQVHPDDAYALQHEQAAGGAGKTEMWYAVSARPGAQVMVGLKPGVTRESFHQAMEEGTAEDCVQHLPVRAGEAIFVPAGTVHTIGPGVVLCEIQENSDLTYRVYDYNRLGSDGKPRPLHVKKAFDVIRFGAQGGGRIEPLRAQRGPVAETYFAACPYFATEKWEFSKRVDAATTPEHFDLLIFLEGRGQLHWGGGEVSYAPAQIWFLPAGLGGYRLEPEERTALLRTYVPDIEQDFVARLRRHGAEEREWSHLVHP